ncbi:GNAT family N-acetyltransferase [Streptococcus pantholopis]|uniref:GCN5 family acetyltransferase n=1 Tax=Streptococcus pantholopis TaxID=1811193 RepID=A0A172Q6I0_9STRE|nr:GNAT family N-acetyltransferase [Streptococcus pantholopis]AND79068.1 GCN5 family acetyltransferase [Streptococcus pantholopis]
MWVCKTFEELTKSELFAIYQVRVAVFIVEQNCPYQEVDKHDLEALHFFKKKSGDIQAYCRIIPGEESVALGRVLTARNCRQNGLGRKLVRQALQICQEKLPALPVSIQAQFYLKDFYASFGFQTTSSRYLEDGIPHIDMILKRN